MLAKNFSLKLIILVSINFFLTAHYTMSDELVVEIDNPKFSEKGLDDRVYEIKAKKGYKSDDVLKLVTVKGKFKTEKDGKWIYLEADKGDFSQSINYIELEKNIFIYTDDGEKIRANQATFDMNKDEIKLEKSVSHENMKGTILSESSIISNNFNKIMYAGNVRSIFRN